MDEDIYHHTEEDENSQELTINAITLNCWGLLFFSKHRLQRIQSIADYLAEQKYDIVFLQEVWVKSDFELIRQQTSSFYKFAYLFPTKSILGTSGLAILSKWSPAHISFIPFTVNGSPFRPWHGDWFTGKGTAYIRIDLQDMRIHLFCTHMHAQYSENEAISDQYSIHRICQSYQLGKFINMTKDLVSHTGKSSELFILAGDLNTSPEEFPFKLLESITGLHDICHSVSKESEDGTVKRRTDLVTCGHSENSYTEPFPKGQSKDDKNRHKQQVNAGKQIDYLLYKLVNRRVCDRNLETSEMNSPNQNFVTCVAEKLPCLTKDPKTGLSFSDHQPVAARFKIMRQTNQHKAQENGDAGYYSSSNINLKRGNFEVVDSNGFMNFSSDSDKCQSVGGKSLQKAAKLVRCYINENESSKHKLTYFLAFFGVAFILALTMANFYHGFMNSLLLVISCTLLTVIFVFIFIVIEIVYRFEQHGICSIIEEMNCSLSTTTPSSVNDLQL